MIDPHNLARRALAEVASGTLNNYFYKSDLTSSIYESILKKDTDYQVNLVETALAQDLTLEYFYNNLAPMIAEMLGDAWKDDTLSFSEVTVALGKLRLLCHEFEEKYLSGAENTHNSTNVLLVSLDGDNHTFGAYMASLKLRKSNINTYLSVSRKESEVLDKIKNGNFAAVGVSVGSEKAIKSVNQLVKTIKKHHDMPIIAGGSFVSNNIDTAKKVLEVDGLEFDAEKIKSYVNTKRNSN